MNKCIRIIAPASSLGTISQEIQEAATRTIKSLGWQVSFGSHVSAENDGGRESVQRRVDDIHDALTDSSVTHLMPVIGGWDTHELLPHIDWDLWKSNPKPLVGYSDITALQNAALALCGIRSIHGPAFSTLGQPSHLEYSIEQLKRSLGSQSYPLKPADSWIDDEWYMDLSAKREPNPNTGYVTIRPGKSRGKLIGGNLSSFMVLAGTKYLPNISGTVVFLEDIDLVILPMFRRMLQQVFMLPGAEAIQGLVFGRMPTASPVDVPTITSMVNQLIPHDIPILANASFGHTYPVGSFPIGAEVVINTTHENPVFIT